MSRTLIMPVGIPAAGKTTFMQEISDRYMIPIVSTDIIRKTLYGDESIQGDFQEVFQKAYKEVNKWIECGVCILDATNVTQWVRDRAIAAILPREVVYIIMDNDINKCKQRNKQRPRVVPDYVLDRMYKNFKRDYPKEDEVYNLKIFNYNDPALMRCLREQFLITMVQY